MDVFSSARFQLRWIYEKGNCKVEEILFKWNVMTDILG